MSNFKVRLLFEDAVMAVSGGVYSHMDISKHLFRNGNRDFLSFSSHICWPSWSDKVIRILVVV